MEARDTQNQLALKLEGHATSQLIAAAVRFGVPDLVEHAPQTAEQVSARTGIPAAIMERFLNALAALDIVEELPDNQFGPTPASHALRRDGGPLHGLALLTGPYYRAWEGLDTSLLTGDSAFAHIHGEDLWSHLAKHADLNEAFTQMMHWNTQDVAEEIVDLLQLPDQAVVADLGAGDGSLSVAVLSRHPTAKLVLVEQQSVMPTTIAAITQRGLVAQCDFTEADLVADAPVPVSAEVFLLKSVLHNGDQRRALTILRNIADSMSPTSRLYVIERTSADDNRKSGALNDMTMLVLFGGSDWSQAEYVRLIESAGLRVTAAQRTGHGYSVLEARG